jgi:hypothetical protein
VLALVACKPVAVHGSGPHREGRLRWIVLFFLAGLPAMFSAMVMPFNLLAALPIAIVSWPVATLAGYRIWRMDHPNDSARAALMQRVGWYTQVAAGAVVTTIDGGSDSDGHDADSGDDAGSPDHGGAF